MLGKLVWDVQQHKDKLWVNIISSKYISNGQFLLTSKSSGSPIWNAISKARLELQDGYSFRIGDGCTSVWYTPWSPYGKISSLVPFVDIHDIDLTLKDLIVGNEWNFDALYTTLPENCKEYLTSKPTLLNNAVTDCFIWSSQLDGTYSAKSRYAWLSHQHNDNNNMANNQS